MTALLLLGLPTGGATAQCIDSSGAESAAWDFDETEGVSQGLLDVVGDFFTPQLVKDVRRIRRYVRNARFDEFRRLCGDLRAADAIFQKALKIVEYDVGRALFVAFMATIEHQRIDLRVPVVGTVGLPLTFEEDSLFLLRFRNLPSRLYHDTPATPFGDRDKLQHFFGSAYLAYAAESPELARSTGSFVEAGEASFVVGGVDDPRDRRANQQGETFGHDLLYVRNLLPSDYLQLPVD
jgi:hypothetical protein